MKKQQLAEKAVRDAEQAEKKVQARKALNSYQKLLSPDEVVSILKPWWPALFDGDTPRLLACGVREMLFEDAKTRGLPVSRKKIRLALRGIVRAEHYLEAMQTGRCRYDPQGNVTSHITPEDAADAVVRLSRVRRQNARKAELKAILGS